MWNGTDLENKVVWLSDMCKKKLKLKAIVVNSDWQFATAVSRLQEQNLTIMYPVSHKQVIGMNMWLTIPSDTDFRLQLVCSLSTPPP